MSGAVAGCGRREKHGGSGRGSPGIGVAASGGLAMGGSPWAGGHTGAVQALNCCLVDRPCKFESLKMLAHLVGRKWWMITFDLAQGYHHVLVEPESRPLMGF
jgi:hypothetical protein